MSGKKSEISDPEMNEIIQKFRKSQELQKILVDSYGSKITTRNIHFLVDTYGLFKGAKDFWSTFSKRRVDWAINFIAIRSLEMIRSGYEIYSSLHYDNLVREYQIGKICMDNNNDINAIKRELAKYNGILRCNFSTTYAAAPDADSKGKKKIERNIFEGLIEDGYGKAQIRSFEQYDDFILHLRRSQFNKGTLLKGYLQLIVENKKIKLSEKEVDSLLIIEAMDILHGGDVQEVVMISKDSDFNPLGHRFWGSGTLYSQVRLGGILSGENKSRIRYEAENEILDQVSKTRIMRDLMNECHFSGGHSLNDDELTRIEDYIKNYH